mgnify:CR=1 FL=1
MELIIIIVLCIILAILVFVLFKNKGGNDSDVIIQLTNSLSNQIQNIRKEINDNSEKSRLEIESKLKVLREENDQLKVEISSLNEMTEEKNKLEDSLKRQLILQLQYPAKVALLLVA